MPIRMPQKRDDFIDLAVEVLQTTAKSQGYLKISKETLAFIIQRYVSKYESPSLPKKVNKKTKLRIISRKD